MFECNLNQIHVVLDIFFNYTRNGCWQQLLANVVVAVVIVAVAVVIV